MAKNRPTGVQWDHAWNVVEAIEHRPGDIEVVHECSYCGERKHGMDVKLPRRGCTVGPKGKTK